MPNNVIDPVNPSRLLVASVIWLSMVAALIANIQPVFLGALAETFSLTGQQLGFISGAELGGSCLASIGAAYWFPRARLRPVAFFAISAGFLGNLVTSWVTGYSELLAIRFFTGLCGTGILYAMMVGLIGQLKNPERIIAIAIFAQVVSLAVGMAGVPLLMSYWQLPGVTISLALLFSTGFFLLNQIPERIAMRVSPEASSNEFRFLPAALLVTLIIFCAGLGSVWAFVERMGSSAGFSMIDVGNALAVAGLVGGLGALAAAVVGASFGRITPLVFALGIEIAACLTLATRSDWYSYLIAIAAFNFSWNLTLPYLMGAIAATDISGRFMVLIPAAQTGGFALGPMLVGVIMVGDGFQVAAWVSMWAFCLCLLLVVPLVRRIPASTADDPNLASPS